MRKAATRVKELERQNRDLEIANRAKDFYLERLEKERGQYVEKLVGMSRYVGELETQVLQLRWRAARPVRFRMVRKTSAEGRERRTRPRRLGVFHREGLRYNAPRYTMEK